jgi:hypothetical protein
MRFCMPCWPLVRFSMTCVTYVRAWCPRSACGSERAELALHRPDAICDGKGVLIGVGEIGCAGGCGGAGLRVHLGPFLASPASSPGVHRQTLHTNFALCVAGAAEAAEALSVISSCSYTHEVEERGVGMGFGPGVPAPPARNPRAGPKRNTIRERALTFSPLLYIPSPSTRTCPPLSFSKAPAHLLQTSDPSHLPATLRPA